ncbi:UDP-4-amino-4,6-dideoxy-N-acetyl-beta-L-altrosamine transaminase [Verrucomicrobia bacterium]|nr:UDP-4-amino-4,6-dideoxy-N-acetyl-beta-L-altrosamine transaminase [Verrucomicrobiota bacterium]MDG1892004.1 UDP-4-amino-4,6-dideoxy-N-acetyl-beta-L-altrosamine transaminase [Verrucomicrobiota bacterium]
MIPYGRQEITQVDIDAVVDVLHSDWLTQGPVVPRFEKKVAAFCQAKHGVAFNSATSALHIACLALELGPGDWLWTSANTFVASANCGLYCGAKVDFVDIDPRTYNMCPQVLSQKLEQAETDGCLPKVVVPVHFGGQPCDMKAIHALAQRYGFRIIEDASHAIGAQYRGKPVGNCRYSHITVFSFHPVKIITTGEGGMALTNDPQIAKHMQRSCYHGITRDDQDMDQRPKEEIWNYQLIDLGFNYRLTDIQAALGLSQLNRLNDFIHKRHAIASRYLTAFQGLPMTQPWQYPESRSSYHLYPVRISKQQSGVSQRQSYDALHRAGIRVNLHYLPVYRHPYYEAMGFSPGYCPEAEKHYRESISLPMFPTLSSESQEKVIKTMKALFS